MNHKWNLDDLYFRFTDERFKADLKYGENIKQKYDRLVKDLFKNHQNEVASIEIFITNLIEDTKRIRKLQAYGHLSFSTNSKSQDALTLKSKVQDITSDMTASMVAFKQWLYDVQDLDALCKKSSVIAEHAFYLNELKASTAHMLSPETASIFCETIVRNAVLSDADDDLKLSILENSLSSATQVIVDILSRYYFETEIFELRKDHPLSVDEFKQIMLEAQKKAYGDGLDHDVLHPYMWLNKTHYYYATRNFYNFPYAFGLLYATGLYSKYLDDPDKFVPAYDDMLRATGKNDIQTVCALMQIDPTKQDFWNASLDKIKEDVDQFEAIINRKLSF